MMLSGTFSHCVTCHSAWLKMSTVCATRSMPLLIFGKVFLHGLGVAIGNHEASPLHLFSGRSRRRYRLKTGAGRAGPTAGFLGVPSGPRFCCFTLL